MVNSLIRVLGFTLLLFGGLSVGCSPGGAVTGTTPPLSSANVIPTGSPASIRIVSPRADAIVPIGANKVEVSLGDAALGKGNAWQLYLDGALINTLETSVLTSTLPISNSGPHEIKASLIDPQNAQLASAIVEVTAAPATPTTSPFNLPWVAPAMGLVVVGVLGLIAIGLSITRPKRAV